MISRISPSPPLKKQKKQKKDRRKQTNKQNKTKNAGFNPLFWYQSLQSSFCQWDIYYNWFLCREVFNWALWTKLTKRVQITKSTKSKLWLIKCNRRGARENLFQWVTIDFGLFWLDEKVARISNCVAYVSCKTNYFFKLKIKVFYMKT